jgi:circadian clock protein KaiB
LRCYCPEAWHVEVVDVLLRPDLAERAGVLATPTLCFDYPNSPRRIIGDLGDVHKVLEFLGIESERREDDDAR